MGIPFFYWLLSGCALYTSIAILIKLFPKLALEVLFLNRLCQPVRFLKLDQPDKVYGLKGAKNTRIASSSGNTLGVWHIPPLSDHNQLLSDARKVIVYCHGNAFHRGFFHRVDLYKELTKAGYHVVAFDYGGYGDSSGRPSVTGMAEDVKSVLKWTTNQLQNKDCAVILWGHSLGTHMSTRALSSMCENEEEFLPECLILEAPFTNAIDVSECFPLSKVFLALYPFLRSGMRQSLMQNNSACPTEDLLSGVSVPILMLHAEDDSRVAFDLGMKLNEKTVSNPATRSQFIRFVRVSKKYKVAHYTASHPSTLQQFYDFANEVRKVKGEERKEKRFEALEI